MLSIFFNPGKIWSVMARTFATPTEQDHEPVFFLFFRLRGKGNAISSVIYRKKNKTFEYFNVCTEKGER